MEKMKAFCGTDCGLCEWKDKLNCKGCQDSQSHMFWGQCDKAKCCIEKEYAHCGFCSDMPCQKLLDLFADPEHGDNGTRLTNLRNWTKG